MTKPQVEIRCEQDEEGRAIQQRVDRRQLLRRPRISSAATNPTTSADRLRCEHSGLEPFGPKGSSLRPATG
jgi:hypothetical protein